LAGCTGSASLRGSASATGGGTSGEAHGTVDLDGEATGEGRPLDVGQIQFNESGELRYGGQINFEYDRADLKSDSDTPKVLNSFKEFMNEHPEVALRIEGHTDSRGSDDYNQKLSDRRAGAVRVC